MRLLQMLIGLFILLLVLALPAVGPDKSSTISTNSSPGSDESGKEGGFSISGPEISSPSGNLSLWAIDGSNNRNTYIEADLGSTVKLLSYTKAGTAAKLCDIQEAGSALTGYSVSMTLPTGYSDGIYQANSAGRHILMLIAGNSASNVVIIEVAQKKSESSPTSSLSPGDGNGVSSGGQIPIVSPYSGFDPSLPPGSSGDWNSLDYGEILIDSRESGFLADVPAGELI